MLRWHERWCIIYASLSLLCEARSRYLKFKTRFGSRLSVFRGWFFVRDSPPNSKLRHRRCVAPMERLQAVPRILNHLNFHFNIYDSCLLQKQFVYMFQFKSMTLIHLKLIYHIKRRQLKFDYPQINIASLEPISNPKQHQVRIQLTETFTTT